MRRVPGAVVTVILLGALFASPLGATGTKVGNRTETQSYVSHGVRTSHEDQGLGTEENYAESMKLTPRRNERSVTVRVADLFGGPVVVYAYQEAARGGEPLDQEFCGVEERYRLVSRKPLELRFYSGLCINHLWGVASAGTVTAEFSREAGPDHSAHDDHDH